MTSPDLEERIGAALKSWAGPKDPSAGFADKVVARAIRRRAHRLTLTAVGAAIAVGLDIVLPLALLPGGKSTTVKVISPPTSPVTATTTPAPTTTTPNPTTTTSPSTVTPAAGVFADSFHFHVTGMTIAANGTATAAWRPGGYGTVARATFHLTSISGNTATGIVDTSTDPAEWTPGHTFRLVLQQNDMLVVTPSPFAPMCGTVASQEALAGHPPPGVNCGA